MSTSNDLLQILKLLLDLRDLDEMGDVALLDLARDARIETLSPGELLSIDDHLDRHLYLIGGEVELQAEGRSMHRVQAGTKRACVPLFRIRTHGLAARALDKATLLSLEQATFERHAANIRDRQVSGITVQEVESDDLNSSLLEEIRQAFYHREVDLPTLPELAIRISQAVQNQDADFKSISATVAADPVIAARTVQVANSAMYAGVRRVESVQQAITRIGLLATRAIVMTVVVKNLFAPVTPVIQHRLHGYYQHSLRVAALSHVIAGRLKGFDPERAFLAGLIHGIGTVPLLILADRHDALNKNAALLDTVIAQLGSPVGETLLRQWEFESEFADVALHAEDWMRDVDTADYCDIVQIAQLHCQLVGGRKPASAPPMSEVPAFVRLDMQRIDPIKLVLQAQQEISEIISLLAG
jgi:HD-like signal output (HDOD) protein